MLLEVLESVIFLETFPSVKWHYTELSNVDSHTLALRLERPALIRFIDTKARRFISSSRKPEEEPFL
jgi:hypothetical protein